MKFAKRIDRISESTTLKLSALASKLSDSGQVVYNLTAGQLPFLPPPEFSKSLRKELGVLKSYQYAPVEGWPDLREKIIKSHEKTREISFADTKESFDCMISNGGKHVLSNILGVLLDPGDEIILFGPYWTSYPELVKLYQGVPKIIETSQKDLFSPNLDKIRSLITPKTKGIILNSPHNPTGIQYDSSWMEGFARLVEEYPQLIIISDEIYYRLDYSGVKPTYYYQKNPRPLKQTVIIDGISKFLASTGLRLGWAIAPAVLIKAMSKLQGQTTSCSNSLIQQGLLGISDEEIESYLKPIKSHLRANANVLKEIYRRYNWEDSFYQPVSAFYYLIDFSNAPVLKKYSKGGQKDYSVELCEKLLKEKSVVTAPGAAFGIPNSLRINMAVETSVLQRGHEEILDFLLRD